jgi:hypothetical protein
MSGLQLQSHVASTHIPMTFIAPRHSSQSAKPLNKPSGDRALLQAIRLFLKSRDKLTEERPVEFLRIGHLLSGSEGSYSFLPGILSLRKTNFRERGDNTLAFALTIRLDFSGGYGDSA